MFAYVSFLFVSVILEPDFHLCRCKTYHPCQVLTFWRGKVSLLTKSSFQFERLRFGKEHSSLSLLLFRLRGFLPLRAGRCFRLFVCNRREKICNYSERGLLVQIGPNELYVKLITPAFQCLSTSFE